MSASSYSCNHSNSTDPNDRFCADCGQCKPHNDENSCPACTRILLKKGNYCPQCGHRFKPLTKEEQKQTSKLDEEKKVNIVMGIQALALIALILTIVSEFMIPGLHFSFLDQAQIVVRILNSIILLFGFWAVAPSSLFYAGDGIPAAMATLAMVSIPFMLGGIIENIKTYFN